MRPDYEGFEQACLSRSNHEETTEMLTDTQKNSARAIAEARTLGLHPVDPANPEGRWGSLALDESWDNAEAAVAGIKTHSRGMSREEDEADGVHSHHERQQDMESLTIEESIALLSAATLVLSLTSVKFATRRATLNLGLARDKLSQHLGIPAGVSEVLGERVRQKVASGIIVLDE